jgi:hypothetical protein
LSGVAGGAALWTPAVEPSLRFFLDATDASTLAGSGGVLSGWTSKASGANVFTPIAGAPSYSPGVVTFATGNTLLTPSRFGIATNPNLTIVAVCTPAGSDQRLVGIGMSASANTVGSLQTQIATTDLAWRYDDGSSVFAGAGSSAKTLFAMTRPTGTYANATARKNGTNQTITTVGSNSIGPTSTTNSTIISRGVWTGSVFGILAFESADQTLIEKAEGWAARYFSTGNELLAQLDASHPYKTTAPTT